MPIAPGTLFGPYEILSAIGAGGMGEVYRARDTRLDRIVALKISKERFEGRIEREARAIASLNHPHICQLYDVGPDYFVMEFVEGAPLSTPLPFEKAIQYSEQILDALDAAHRRGITHRDLKPANILVTREGIKLLDFGLAKLQPTPLQDMDRTIADSVTKEGHIVGTLTYMSPEQLQGREVDARSDLFSFGCVLYEMLSGRRAFDGESSASIIGAILEREPAPLEATPPLDRVVRRALAKDAENRFQTARDLKAALIWAAEPALGPGGKTPETRNWLPWATAAVAAACVVLLAVFWLLRASPAGVASMFAIQPPRGVIFNYRITGSAISPDGKFLVFRASGESGSPLLWLRPLDSLEARPLAGTEGGDYPFWSPDGKSLAYFAGGKLEKVDVLGGPPTILCDADAANAVAGGTWNRNGTILFGDRKGLSIVSTSGGSASLVFKAGSLEGEAAYGYPQFLPDGKHFLYFIESSDRRREGVYAASLDRPQDHVQILMTSAKAIFAPPFASYPGLLLFLRGGSLVAQHFEPGSFRLEGEPQPVAGNLSVLPAIRGAAFWASDNGLLVYRSGLGLDKLKLVWVGRDGKGEREAAPEGAYTSLQLSPDGKRVAIGRRDVSNFTDLSDVWVLDVERGTMSRFTFGPEWNACPVWSPDGSEIAFSSSRGGVLQLYRKNPAGGAPEEALTSNNPEFKCALDWSRDGKYLIYGQSDRGLFDIWALPLVGDKKPELVVQPSFNKADAQLSPDGRWLAYTSDESGGYEVYVKAFAVAEGASGERWQVSNHGGRAPRWRGDGKELFYPSPTDRMEAVEIQVTGRGVGIGAPRDLFAVSVPGNFGENEYPYDVTADGQHFLIEQTAGAQDSSPLTVEVNWQAALGK